MNKKLLNKFFKENADRGELPTASAIAHFYLTLEKNPEAHEKIREMLDNAVPKDQPERKEKAADERREIESAETCEQILRIMRRNTDPVNQHILVNRAMDFENEIVPEIVRMLRTSLNTGFIETAIRILAKSTIDVTAEIFGYYSEMRNPYAQEMVLVVLGFKAEESRIPWFIEQHADLKKRYPNENYCDGAYYALYEIESRFYPVHKTEK